MKMRLAYSNMGKKDACRRLAGDLRLGILASTVKMSPVYQRRMSLHTQTPLRTSRDNEKSLQLLELGFDKHYKIRSNIELLIQDYAKSPSNPSLMST